MNRCAKNGPNRCRATAPQICQIYALWDTKYFTLPYTFFDEHSHRSYTVQPIWTLNLFETYSGARKCTSRRHCYQTTQRVRNRHKPYFFLGHYGNLQPNIKQRITFERWARNRRKIPTEHPKKVRIKESNGNNSSGMRRRNWHYAISVIDKMLYLKMLQ